MMRLVQSQALVQEQSLLEISFGSIFVGTDKLLGKRRFQKALFHFLGKDLDRIEPDFEKFRSMMDFLVVQVFPFHRDACFKYYDDEGPQLKELISEKTIKAMDKHLQNFLYLCLEAYQEHESLEWSFLIEQGKIDKR